MDYPSNVLFVTRLGGRHLQTIENAFYCAPERNESYSEHAQWIPQYKLEEVLREHARSLPAVTFRFDCEFQTCRQDGDQVHSVLTDLRTQEPLSVDSDFLIGADGARSVVRQTIGAKLEGEYGLSHNYNIILRPPTWRRPTGMAPPSCIGRSIPTRPA